MNNLVALLEQIWQGVGWNGISAIAALLIAINTLWKRKDPSAIPPPSQQDTLLNKFPYKQKQNRKKVAFERPAKKENNE